MDALTPSDENPGVLRTARDFLWRLLTTPYRPDLSVRTYESRAQTQENANAQRNGRRARRN